ncbi:hypothetical protein [Planococcus chinensis]|uniref:Uncharacterized protein n=1 Tax=Planococcus chinensis TaxID=272917 RepID=A0ABW4QEZ8_9BACL
MAVQRITVGYVELTEQESEALFEKVKKDKGIDSYDALQDLMEDFDSQIIEPVSKPLKEVLGADEAPAEPAKKSTRFIEVFNTVKDDSRYRIPSSDQS